MNLNAAEYDARKLCRKVRLDALGMRNMHPVKKRARYDLVAAPTLAA